jgi:serine/threonine-protein kinase RsbW
MPKNTIEVDIRVPNQTRYLRLIGEIGEDIAKELNRNCGTNENLAYNLNLVLTEAMVNAIKYAHDSDPDKTIHIIINVTEVELNIKVYDSGQGFDINDIPPPDFENPEDQGRGIFIIKCLMDSVTYKKINGMNVLEICKKLNRFPDK